MLHTKKLRKISEIRFRAWNTKEGKMYYFEPINKVVTLTCLDVNFDSTMQYIGIKDKNNKMIYEGDVVYCPKFQDKYLVYWNEEFCGFYPFADDTNCSWCGKGIYSNDVKIVGNIYTDPNLQFTSN
ncbi:MAG: YopX family protein [Cetobacterium sp.]